MTELKQEYMERAIQLALLAQGKTNPNPLVGAVIVKDGVIIGEGYHHQCGMLHAEREALADCKIKGNNPEGATIYVTLEPCCHFGKQPPCTQALVESKIATVVVGSRDPNPLVHGKGNEYLRQNNIQVIEDFLKEKCDAINPIFFHYITTKRPYVALKYAMTLDGKIATKTGDSQWITNEDSRNYVHQLRNQYKSILVGIGTVLSDDPMLNCRLPNGINPLRLVCDTKLNIPLQSKLVTTAKQIPTVVFCGKVDSQLEQKKQKLEEQGVEVVSFPDSNLTKPAIDLKKIVEFLGQKNIDSLLIEGGAQINFSAFESGIVNKVYAFVGAKIFGGSAKSPVGGEGIEKVQQSWKTKLTGIKQFKDDVMLEMEVL